MRCLVQGCPGLDATPRRLACSGHWLNVERHFSLSTARLERLAVERRAVRAVMAIGHAWIAVKWTVWALTAAGYCWAFGRALGAW